MFRTVCIIGCIAVFSAAVEICIASPRRALDPLLHLSPRVDAPLAACVRLPDTLFVQHAEKTVFVPHVTSLMTAENRDPCVGAEAIPDSSIALARVNYTRLAILGGTSLTVGVGLHIYQRIAWWVGARAAFHVENDWSYAINFDKIGHFWATALLSSLYGDLYTWAGIERKDAVLYGAATGFLYELYVEAEDGFHRDWGFSPGDAFGDVLGAFYPVLQEQFPLLQNLNFKWSYWPDQEYLKRYGANHAFVDDYQGTTLWATVRVHRVLPEKVRAYWPSFLNLALGLNVQGLYNGSHGERYWFLSLDYDLEELPGSGSFWNSVKRFLNHVHLPAPAVRISPGVVWYGLFFTAH